MFHRLLQILHSMTTRLRIAPDSSTRITAIDLAMMERALELAKKAAELDEVPVGAVVYMGNKIISEGHNLRESSHDPVAHAELLAVSRAGRALGAWRLSECTLAVTLEPCAMCAGALVNSRVERLVYAAADPKAGFCGSLGDLVRDGRLNHRLEVTAGVLARESGELLREFFAGVRRAVR